MPRPEGLGTALNDLAPRLNVQSLGEGRETGGRAV